MVAGFAKRGAHGGRGNSRAGRAMARGGRGGRGGGGGRGRGGFGGSNNRKDNVEEESVETVNALRHEQNEAQKLAARKRQRQVERKLKKRVLDKEAMHAFLAKIEKEQRHEDWDRSLHISGLPSTVTKKDLEDIQRNIEIVKLQKGNTFAVLVFRNLPACKAAYKVMSTTPPKVLGHTIAVEQCKETEIPPIDPLRLLVYGIPKDVSKTKLKAVFRGTTRIDIPAKYKKKIAYIKFRTAEEASAGLEKGKGLKIGGHPVEVMRDREKKERDEQIAKEKELMKGNEGKKKEEEGETNEESDDEEMSEDDGASGEEEEDSDEDEEMEGEGESGEDEEEEE